MSDSTALARAIALAADVHADQIDKGGEPYILHPLRVMQDAMDREDGSWVVGIVAVLHDVIEDNTKYGDRALRDRIEDEFGSQVREMVELLTKRRGQDYFEYIKVIKDSETYAVQIKLADLRDNMTILRQPTLMDKDLLRLQRYHMAYRILDRRYT